MSHNWIDLAQGALLIIALAIASLLMPGRIVRFLRTLNNDRVLYPTSLLRDMGVLFLIGLGAGIVGALALDWMFVDDWESGQLLDLSHGFEGTFAAVLLWQGLTMIPFLIVVDQVSEHRAKKRLEAAAGGAPDPDRLRQVSEIHSVGDGPIDNPVVLPGAILVLSDWAISQWSGGVPFAFFAHVLSWALPMGLAFASLRLIGIRI